MAENQQSNGFALITGSSSGIGAAFAHRLAVEGYDLILVARRKEKLDSLAAEIRRQSSVTVEVLTADLSQDEAVQRVAERIQSCPNLSMLINNAGFGYPGTFWDVDPQGQLAMINVHVTASTLLCRAVLPGMLERQAGAIINVSSIASFAPRRTGTLYHATKAYLNAFTSGLAAELTGTPIMVQVLCPGFTVTEFHDNPGYKNFKRSSIPSFLWLRAEDVVHESLRDLQRGKLICVPGRAYRLMVFMLTNSFTKPFAQFVSSRMIRRKR